MDNRMLVNEEELKEFQGLAKEIQEEWFYKISRQCSSKHDKLSEESESEKDNI